MADDTALIEWLESLDKQSSDDDPPSDDDLIGFLGGLDDRWKKADAMAKALSRTPVTGIGEHTYASQLAPEDRPLLIEAARRQYQKDRTMKKVGFGARTAMSAVQGMFDYGMPLAKGVGAVPRLDAEQEGFYRQLLGVRQGEDPVVRPDTPLVGQWTQKAVRMAFPMAQAIGAGTATGGAVTAAGAGPWIAGAAAGVGTSGTYYPQISEGLYSDLIADGVPEDRAKVITRVFAPAEAAIESIIRNPWAKGAQPLQGTGGQIFRQIARQYAKNYAGELSEEGLQGITHEAARQFASQTLDKPRAERFMKAWNTEAAKAGWEAVEESAGPLLIMTAPGAARMGVEGAAAMSRTDWSKATGKPRSEAPPAAERNRIQQKMEAQSDRSAQGVSTEETGGVAGQVPKTTVDAPQADVPGRVESGTQSMESPADQGLPDRAAESEADGGESAGRAGVGLEASQVPAEPPRPKGTPSPRRPSPEQQIRSYAAEVDLSPDDLLDAAETVHQGMKEDHDNRLAAKRAAHQRTGLSGADMRRLENKGFDHSSGANVGGKTGEKLKHFDKFASELVGEHRGFFGQVETPARAVWDLLRAPASQNLRLDDPDVMAEAEAMVRSADRPTIFGSGLPVGTDAPGVMKDAGVIPRFFRARGNLPKEIHDAVTGMFAEKAGRATEARFLLDDLKAIARPYSPETVNAALAGERTLPDPKAQAVVERMRDAIDGMTDEMLDRGLFHPDIEEDVRARKGHYLHRSYQIFDDPLYRPTPAKRRAVRAWLKKEHPEWTKEELDGELANLEEWPKDSGSVSEAFSKAGFNKMANEIFKQRKDVPKVLREFWGEYKDPRVNFAKTVGSMSDVLAKNAMLEAFVRAGAGRWFHERSINTSDGMFSVKVPAELPLRLDPTKPLYTSKEILQSLKDVFGPHTSRRWLGIINAIAKWGKTVGSIPSTHVRNYMSWYYLVLSEGNFFFTGAGRGHRGAWGELFGTNDKALRDEIVDAAKYGVAGRGARAGELAAQIREAVGTGWEGALPKPVAAGLKGVQKAYQAEDDVWKVTSWLYNRQLYADALGKSVHDPEIKQRAAEIVQSTTPTYDMAPEIVQLWRRNPFVGPFVVWPAEMIRIHANRIRLAAEEMRTPGLRGVGVRRLGAMLAANAVIYGAAVPMLSQLWAGMGDDDDEAARKLMAPWDQDAVNLWTRYDKKAGQGTFVNLSYTIPSAMFAEPIIGVIKGDPEEPAIKRASRSILGDFLGPELGLAAVGEAFFNMKLDSGQSITPENAEFVDQVIGRGGHILEALQPNTFNTLNRVYKGYVGHESEWKKYDFKTEVGAGLGVRFATFDVGVSLQWRAKEFQKAKTQAGYSFRRAINALGDYDEETTRREFAKSAELRAKTYRVLIGQVEAAKQLGRSDIQINQALQKGGVAKKYWSRIRTGKIPAIVASDIEIRTDRITNRAERFKLRNALVGEYNKTLREESESQK